MIGYYITGIIILVFALIYIVSYKARLKMIRSYKEIFDKSGIIWPELSHENTKKYGSKFKGPEERYGSNANILIGYLLTSAKSDCKKLKNIFNWKKEFLFGGKFAYTKYLAIMAWLEKKEIDKKIDNLILQKIALDTKFIYPALGIVWDKKRMKRLAGISKDKTEEVRVSTGVQIDSALDVLKLMDKKILNSNKNKELLEKSREISKGIGLAMEKKEQELRERRLERSAWKVDRHTYDVDKILEEQEEEGVRDVNETLDELGIEIKD